MKSPLRSKLLFAFAALVMIATALLIPLSSSLMHSYAERSHALLTALPTGILPTPSGTPPSPTPTIEPAHWTVLKHIPYVTIAGVTYIFNLYTPSPAPGADTPLLLVFHGCSTPGVRVKNPAGLLPPHNSPISPLPSLFPPP